MTPFTLMRVLDLFRFFLRLNVPWPITRSCSSLSTPIPSILNLLSLLQTEPKPTRPTSSHICCIRLLASYKQCCWQSLLLMFWALHVDNNITICFLFSGNQVNCSRILSMIFIVELSHILLSLNPSTLMPMANPSEPHVLGYNYGYSQSLSNSPSKPIANANTNVETMLDSCEKIIAYSLPRRPPPYWVEGGDNLVGVCNHLVMAIAFAFRFGWLPTANCRMNDVKFQK